MHQDRITSRTRERERDQTHSYWYIPSAPRVNYSLLVMESTGMMRMATGEGFPPPLRQRVGMGLDWFSVSTEASGDGNPDLGYFLEVSVFIGIFGVGLTSRGSMRWRQDRGCALGGWACPLPRGSLVSFLTCTPSLSGCFPSKITSPEGFIPFRLRLIFLFFETLKQGKKQELALGSGSMG